MPPAGETFRLHLESLTHQGAALARRDGQVVFAAYGIPGEDADVLIERVHKDYLEGRVVGVHEPSPWRVQPRCEYFGECGGCQLQHISYEGQLELKRQIVTEQMRRIGKLTDIEVLPTLPSPDPWHYRNHARFSVDREGYLGFTMRGRKRIVRTMTCYIVHPWIRATLQKLQGRCRGLRQVAMRIGVNTGSTLIQPRLEGHLSEPPLIANGPDVVPPPRRPIAEAELGTESGQPWYEEELLGHRFRISAASFFQVNTPQAENLVRLVRDGLALAPVDVLLDAYAGVGTFAKTLASLVRKVIAIEVSASSVADGRYNTRENPNVEWIPGEVEAVLPRLAERPTAVVLDPSRQGCGAPALAALIAARVPRVAYVSCEPATLARDLRILVDGGYRV
ncbi:MAG: 23S rRNA (uracil(1939)-C(5))-methyltransferase RlmD, partial [Chloroflexota bacterium]